MIGQSLFLAYYPGYVAALRGQQSAAEGIGSGSSFDDSQPPSAFSSTWGTLGSCVEIPIQCLFRSEPSRSLRDVVNVCGEGNFRAAAGSGGGGFRLSGKQEISIPEGVPTASQLDVSMIGVPTLPGTKPGADTFDALVRAMVAAGLAASSDESEPVLLGTVWLKGPGTTSRSVESLAALRHAYYQLVVQDIAMQATVEKYVPGAVMVEVDVSNAEAPEEEVRVVGLKLKKRPQATSERTPLESTDLPAGQSQILFHAARKAAHASGIHGMAMVKFLFDPTSKEVFFLKIKKA